VAPVAEAPAAPAAARSRQVSIQTGSADELARIKGLNLRVAKEIIKARPFAALEDVLKVEGVGRKTFDRIRSLITL
jgi:competence ComEA-like helix-hairpin-helix protein